MPGERLRAEVFALFAEHVSSGKVAFFERAGMDFALGRREGAFLWDVEGERRLIDCHCNGGVFNLGHRHPDCIAALRTALDELDIGNHHLISPQRAALAESLAELTPGDLAYTVFGVGGGEAVDLAIKVARAFTGRSGIVSARGGYHGHTGLALAAGDEKFRAPFGPAAPGFKQVEFGDADAMAAALGPHVAAVLLETIPATLGIVVPPDGYLEQVRWLCDAAGALLIIDEVQTGLGRTGRLWGVDHYGVTPDLMVLGKGLSGGVFPLTATVFRRELDSVFHDDPFLHISTFGGAELGCPVAARVLELSSEPAFLAHVRSMGARFSAGFGELRDAHPGVLAGSRGVGLMLGLELTDPAFGPLLSKTAFDSGLLAIYAYHDPSVVQFLPPLTIEPALADEILDRLDTALTALEAIVGGRRGG
ncbi:MAG: aspartate aminotransferase family protein [Actinobacteria bacterium]|nr:aspartate aminotransferase family protein [Actinomycetota bacterium]